MNFLQKFGSSIEAYQKKYWNDYFPKTNIYYPARPGWKVNISQILNVPDAQKNEIEAYFKEKHPEAFKAKSDDERALFAFNWVRTNIKYVGDFEATKLYEFWNNPFETFKSRVGDCEDQHILMYFICEITGMPTWKLRLIASDVSYKDKIAGHCYLVYLTRGVGDWGYEFYSLDSCYYSSTSLSSFRNTPIRFMSMYNPTKEPIWWGFNKEFEWKMHSWDLPTKKIVKAQDIVLGGKNA